MSRYSEIIDDISTSVFSNSDKNKLKRTLIEWAGTSRGAYIVTNIRKETCLGTNSMIDLLKSIIDCHSKPINELESFYEQECWNTIHHYNSQIIDTTSLLVFHGILGRLVTVDSFKRVLKSQSYSRRKIRDMMFALRNNRPLNLAQKNTKLAIYPVWATWSQLNDKKDPFYFANNPSKALKIRANLGLSENQDDEEFMVLVYNISLPLYYPTIANAGLFDYFSPVNKNDRPHGLTKNWHLDSFKSKNSRLRHKPSPKPEAIHRPDIKLNNLVRFVEFVKD